MIKIENMQSYGWETAIRGMRNAMNSWNKSDSDFSCKDCEGCYYIGTIQTQKYGGVVDNWCQHTALRIGPNDLALMQKLIKAGTDHSKFMRQIIVSMDITAPLYWWKEFDTYKVGTVANSCSTMHKIHSKPFTMADFSCERMDDHAREVLFYLVSYLENWRIAYNDTKNKTLWHNIIQTLPSSYNQRRTVTLNYAVLRNMHHARENHKLYEWQDFCHEISTLPYAKELICYE